MNILFANANSIFDYTSGSAKSIRLILEESLTSSGFETKSFSSGEELIKELDATQPDLIITDVQMPGMLGYDLLKHINNNHSKLTLNQIRDLLDIQKVVAEIFESISLTFANKSFGDVKNILKEKNKTIGLLEDKIETQISRTRTSEEKSPKNAALYFSILQESKDLMKEVMNLIEEYYVSYDKSVKPAKPKDE